MIRTLTLLACSTLSLVASTPTPDPGPQPASAQVQARDAAGFPLPTEPLVLPKASTNDVWTLDELIRVYGEWTGQHLIYDRDVGALLQSTALELTQDMTIPPDKAHTVIESLMRRHDFVFGLVHAESPRILTVYSLNTGARTQLRASAVFVPASQRQAWVEHPAYLIQTVLQLDRLDVRTLTNSLRTLMTDANTQNVIPVGRSNHVILTGFPDRVHELAIMLEQVNAEAPEPEEPTPAPAGAPKEER